MTNATLNATTSHTPPRDAVMGDNAPSTARVKALLADGLANEDKAAALSFTGKQQIALAAMVHHASLVLMDERPAPWTAMTDKTGDADTKGQAFTTFRNALYDMVATPLEKLKKGDAVTVSRAAVVAQNKRTHANITNGVKLAVQLTACGVDEDDYVATAKGGAFKLPLSALCPTGFKLAIASKQVMLDGTTYGLVSEGTGVGHNIQANVAQLQRAVASRKPKIVPPEKDTSQADELAAEGATGDTAEGNSTTPTPPASTPGKSGAQPSTAPDSVPPGDMDALLIELGRILHADSRPRVLIDDFTPKAWNALQALVDFAHDVSQWTMEEEEEKASAAA